MQRCHTSLTLGHRITSIVMTTFDLVCQVSASGVQKSLALVTSMALLRRRLGDYLIEHCSHKSSVRLSTGQGGSDKSLDADFGYVSFDSDSTQKRKAQK